MKVYVVGGYQSLVRGTLAKRLAEHGAEVIGHFDGYNGAHLSIPAEAEAVILVKDVASHDLFKRTKAAANERQIPFACIQRKWAQALPVLQAAGIVKERS